MAEDTTSDLVDITSLVEECSASLSVENSILHSDAGSFSLHDAMAALELMDRKMDCCEIPASVVSAAPLPEGSADYMVPPRPLPTGLDDEIAQLPWQGLSLGDASLIALEALTGFEAMLSGASVAESIYTCLYVHNPVLLDMKGRLQDDEHESTPAQHALYATCLAMVTISRVFREIVLNADIYEEEDFTAQTYGLEFFDGATVDEAVHVLENALNCIRGIESTGARSLGLILGFQLDFLKACAPMMKPSNDDVAALAECTQETVKSGLETLKELATATADRVSDAKEAALLKRCFDPFMYRILVGNAPVRKVAFRTQSESISILTTILSEVGWTACDLLLNGSSLAQVRRKLSRWSRLSVDVLSRSIMVLHLYFNDKFLGQHDLDAFMTADLKRLAAVADILITGTYGQAFFTRLAKPIYDTLKVFLLNRNRQQAYLEAVMIPDWASLEEDARVVDMNYHMEHSLPQNSPSFFSNYVFYSLGWLMDHHVALGLELNLFHGHYDLAIAYWYRDFLLSTLLNTMTTMKRTKPSAPAHVPEETSKSKVKKKGAKGSAKKGRNNSQVGISHTQDDVDTEFDLMLVALKQGMSRGIARFLAALRQAELISPPSYEFTSHEKRFQKRFESFSSVATPVPLTYDDFLAGSDFSAVTQADLLSATADSFSAAKAMANRMLATYNDIDSSSVNEEELRSLAKVCVGNSIYVMKLSQQVTGGGKVDGKVEFDFETNSEFCIVKIG